VRGRTRFVGVSVAAVVLVASTVNVRAQGGLAPSQPTVLRSQVSTDPNIAAGEAWVVTDPTNPQRVVVVWLGTRDSGDPVKLATASGYCGVALSTDGGKTWSTKALPFKETTSPKAISKTDDVPICGDPVAGVGPDGTLFTAAANVGSPSWTQGLTSVDHGWSWSDPTEVFGATQLANAAAANPGHRTPAIAMGRAYMAVDPTTGDVSVHSQEDGGVEGRWLAVSSDHGKTWSTPRPLDPDIQSSSAGPQSAAGGKIGVVYTVNTTSPEYLASPKPAVTCPTGQTSCTVFETTTDKGVTWSRHVMPFAGSPSGFTGQIVAADPSHLGRFAVLFTTNSGQNVETWVTPDSGSSWVRTNTFTAPTGESFTKPWIAYSPTGALGIVWRTPHGSTVDVRAIVSRDGGTRFSVPVVLQSGIPASNSPVPGDDCACNLHLDTTTLSATWADASTGERQIYYGRFDYTRLP
jgi:hypothetical protein